MEGFYIKNWQDVIDSWYHNALRQVPYYFKKISFNASEANYDSFQMSSKPKISKLEKEPTQSKTYMTQRLIAQNDSTKKAQESIRFNTGNNVRKVVLELNGSANIEFVPSNGNSVVISEIRYNSGKQDPLALFNESDVVRIKQRADNYHFVASYKLSIPSNVDLEINGGHINLNGSITAKSLNVSAGLINANASMSIAESVHFNAGSVNLNIEFSKCGSLKIASGALGGRITVPKTTIIPNVPAWSALKIVRK